MDNINKFLSSHPLSSIFSIVPLTIDASYHAVIAQLIGGLGLQFGLFFVEFLYKKFKIKKRSLNYEQSYDEFLQDKDPTKFR